MGPSISHPPETLLLQLRHYINQMCHPELDLIVKEKMLETIDDAGKKIWSCSICYYTSNKTTNMYKHIERKHLNVNLSCELCQKVFKSRDDPNVHKRSHSSD